MNVSVVLAAYNGEKYIEEQLGSIVPFLEEGDELIVSDDGSSDGTLDIVRAYQKKYPSIRITEGAHGGSSANFASTVPKCQGSIVLFCDQDDVWMPDKLNRIKEVFREDTKAELVMHNAGFCDSNGDGIGDFNGIIQKGPLGGGYIQSKTPQTRVCPQSDILRLLRLLHGGENELSDGVSSDAGSERSLRPVFQPNCGA